jgi:hypothetical protein
MQSVNNIYFWNGPPVARGKRHMHEAYARGKRHMHALIRNS